MNARTSLPIARRLLVALLAVAAPLAFSGCITIPLGVAPTGMRHQKIIRDSETFFSAGKLLLVDINGVIQTEGTGDLLGLDTGQGMVSAIAEDLAKARKDGNIRAVLIRINSPGGGITASDIIHDELKRFKEEKKVPVYAVMLDVAASGGYYVAMAADEISAMPTTVTGSIGVIASFPLLKQLFDYIGYEDRTFKSGANKDMGNVFREMTEEQRQIIQQTIDGMYERFVGIVVAGRPRLGEAKIRELADGRVYTADEAKAHGLIDHIEYMPDVIKRIEKKVGGSLTIVTYNPGMNYGSSLYVAGAEGAGAPRTQAPGVPSQVTVKHTVPGLELLKPGFYYLWRP